MTQMFPSQFPTVEAMAHILTPQSKRPRLTATRRRRLENLESQLMARIHYHQAELVRLGFGCGHDWEDVEDALRLHEERSTRLKRTLSAVRVVLCN